MLSLGMKSRKRTIYHNRFNKVFSFKLPAGYMDQQVLDKGHGV